MRQIRYVGYPMCLGYELKWANDLTGVLISYTPYIYDHEGD